MSSSRRALAGGVERGRRLAVPGLLPALALALIAAVAPLAAAAQPLAGGDELVWITLGEDLYLRA
ncbi:MAG TPA: hypothetical protein VLA66_10145, partial [Thermoanaerobaculia bacterium]|nr:hypothetical protein [Thermoanaerobaculia bacterium]